MFVFSVLGYFGVWSGSYGDGDGVVFGRVGYDFLDFSSAFYCCCGVIWFCGWGVGVLCCSICRVVGGLSLINLESKGICFFFFFGVWWVKSGLVWSLV